MKCPKCGSTNISVERRPDGFSRCHKCGNSWQHERKTPELTTAEKLMWLVENKRLYKIEYEESNRPNIQIMLKVYSTYETFGIVAVWAVWGDTIEQAINKAYDYAKEYK